MSEKKSRWGVSKFHKDISIYEKVEMPKKNKVRYNPDGPLDLDSDF